LNTIKEESVFYYCRNLQGELLCLMKGWRISYEKNFGGNINSDGRNSQ